MLRIPAEFVEYCAMKVLVAHVIITAHGFWLPNDPRGSWSDFVGAWELSRMRNDTREINLFCWEYFRVLGVHSYRWGEIVGTGVVMGRMRDRPTIPASELDHSNACQ